MRCYCTSSFILYREVVLPLTLVEFTVESLIKDSVNKDSLSIKSPVYTGILIQFLVQIG